MCLFPVLKVSEIKKKTFILQTEASNVGLGAALLQVDIVRRQVAFGGKLNAIFIFCWNFTDRYQYHPRLMPLSHLSKRKVLSF